MFLETKSTSSPNKIIFKILLGSIILVLLIFVFGLMRKSGQKGTVAGVVAEQLTTVTGQKLTSDYEAAAGAIVTNYQNDVDLLLSGDLAADQEKWRFMAGNALDKLLELTVPKSLMDLHWELVTVFSTLSAELAENNNNSLKASTDKLERMITDYPWLITK